MQEHHFRVQFDEYSADFVLGGKHTLYDLAAFIIKTIGFDFDHAFEFCNDLKRPYKSTERYTLFADIGQGDGEPGVKATQLEDVFRPKRAMVFHFDYGDDWMFLITCTAVKESEAKRRFRRVLATTGKPPEQYPDCEE